MQVLLQIRIGIRRQMPDPRDQAAWLRAHNRHLDGQAPLEAMTTSCHDMVRVRDLVEGWTR